jgi:mycofactocin precursor
MPETAQDEMTTTQATGGGEDPLVEEYLVEEVSIDGMCGVY